MVMRARILLSLACVHSALRRCRMKAYSVRKLPPDWLSERKSSIVSSGTCRDANTGPQPTGSSSADVKMGSQKWDVFVILQIVRKSEKYLTCSN